MRAVVGVHLPRRHRGVRAGRGSLLLVPRKGDERRIAVHGGAILSAAGDGDRIVTGGDDGKVMATDASGASHRHRHRRQAPLDRSRRDRARRRGSLVGRQDRIRAHRQGRRARARRALDRRRACLPAEGLPARDRALQRRDALVSERQGRARDGSSGRARISASTVSPDGRFLVTAMQEPTLHGWRMADRKDMRMRAIRRACARSTGAPTANGSRPRARPS